MELDERVIKVLPFEKNCHLDSKYGGVGGGCWGYESGLIPDVYCIIF